MIILLTGTPGTGKSTVSNLLSDKSDEIRVIRLNDLAKADEDVCVGFDEKRESKVIDIKKLSKKVRELIKSIKEIEVIKGNTLIEGHLSHHLPFGDITIVLRADPKVLEKRLDKKGFSKEKINENLEAEALDVCLVESIENHEKVYEIDTTDKSPRVVKEKILKIIDGKGDECEHLPGKIEWCEDFFQI